MSTEVHKKAISDCLSITMANRRKWIQNECPTITIILKELPRLGDFKSEMPTKYFFYFSYSFYKK